MIDTEKLITMNDEIEQLAIKHPESYHCRKDYQDLVDKRSKLSGLLPAHAKQRSKT